MSTVNPGVVKMNKNFIDSRREQKKKRAQTCTDNICRENVWKEDHHGDFQENRERLICKIGLC